MIIFEKISKSFQYKGDKASWILSDIHFSIYKGEFVCIIGPSGCGKTTLLNLVAGFISPSKGRVLFDGKKIKGPGPDRGVVFQDATLFPWLTVMKNVEFGLKLQGIQGATRVQTARHYLESLGMADHAEKYPHTLSGGMRQRVAIARVLALEPQVMLMDEPFSALDANTRERLQDELLRIWMNDHRTIVYVTHSVDEAAYLADRIIILGNQESGISADIPNTQKRPRSRESDAYFAMKETLRTHLAAQPCCIPPQGA